MHNKEMGAFLAELSALTAKHGFVISGCGCCFSPRVDKIDDEQRKGHVYFVQAGDEVDPEAGLDLSWKPDH